jgi:FAD-linked sulfhydryl oxidase
MSDPRPQESGIQPKFPKTLFPHQIPAAASSSTASKDDDVPAGMTKLPNGVILDKDGKPYVASMPYSPRQEI